MISALEGRLCTTIGIHQTTYDLKKISRRTCLHRYYQACARSQEINLQNMFTPILSGLHMTKKLIRRTCLDRYYWACVWPQEMNSQNMFTPILSCLRTTSRNELAEHVYTNTIRLAHDLKKLTRTWVHQYYQAYAWPLTAFFALSLWVSGSNVAGKQYIFQSLLARD